MTDTKIELGRARSIAATRGKDAQRGRHLSCIFGTRFARRLASPALEGMRKGADVSVAKQPCNLRNRQVSVGQMAICEVGSETVQKLGEREPFP